MDKKLKITVITLALVAILGGALAGASLVYAQGPANPGNPGGPMGGSNGWMAQYQDEMHAAIAEALGMTVEEFEAALASGQTAWQIAEAQGFTFEEFQALMQDIHEDVLAQAVADGVITQEQADWMLARMRSGGGPMGGGRGGRGGRAGGNQGGYGGNCPYNTP